jgi:polysaccharide export outer membrane protein
MTRSAFRLLPIIPVLLFSACSNLPASGPSNDQVLEQINSTKNPLGVHLVELTPSVVETLRARQEPSLSMIDSLRTNRPVDQLGPGDVLSITIYEAGNGLFTPQHTTTNTDNSAGPTPSSTAETLPRLQVDRNGMIMVPYAGEIHVAGQTTTAVQRLIESRLAQKTSQAQVLVSLVTNGSNVVYVSGDVKNPGRYPLSLAHETLLDMLALAGGPTYSPQDTLVKVNRHQQEATTTLTRVQTVPQENIPVEPLDRIQFDYLPRSFLSFGASGKVAQIKFDAATVSLAEAVARVGGLNDDKANPEAVFLFRFERPGNANALGVGQLGSNAAKSAAIMPGAMAQGIPVVYRINMRDPQSYFAIQQFAMQDKDLIYVANAQTVQLYKFLQLIFTFTSPLITGAAVGTTF